MSLSTRAEIGKPEASVRSRLSAVASSTRLPTVVVTTMPTSTQSDARELQRSSVVIEGHHRFTCDPAAVPVEADRVDESGSLARVGLQRRELEVEPRTAALTHETVAKTLLGIDPTGPRW